MKITAKTLGGPIHRWSPQLKSWGTSLPQSLRLLRQCISVSSVSVVHGPPVLTTEDHNTSTTASISTYINSWDSFQRPTVVHQSADHCKFKAMTIYTVNMHRFSQPLNLDLKFACNVTNRLVDVTMLRLCIFGLYGTKQILFYFFIYKLTCVLWLTRMTVWYV